MFLLAILSLRCGDPREGLEAWSPDPSTHPSSTQTLEGGGAAVNGWMGVWTSCMCGCARMAESVCQGTCRGAGRALCRVAYGV